ncbi:SSI family serine proteinase inhibitor [Streptomyces sp. NBC_00435]|uniref:SSI family serine proteinase inhibitor n=1 Tax=Streptomyces sp. NBC_00435 TaxID=2903649 RepID=UPI002E23296F
MRSVTRNLGLSSAAMGLVALTALVGSSPAGAAPSGTESLYAPSALVLSVTQGDDSAGGTVLRAVTLTCAPRPSGTHPAAAAACAELRANAPERLDALAVPLPEATCTREWDPMTVRADGVWQGRHLSYTYTYSNQCGMRNSTGTLFGF